MTALTSSDPGSRPDAAQERPSTGPVPVHTGSPNPPRRLLRGAEQLAYLVGSRLLVGITHRGGDGSVVRTEQFCGRVLEVADGVVVVERAGGQAVLPADPAAYEVAQRGRYVLSGSGENVVDPDYVTIWDVQADA